MASGWRSERHFPDIATPPRNPLRVANHLTSHFAQYTAGTVCIFAMHNTPHFATAGPTCLLCCAIDPVPSGPIDLVPLCNAAAAAAIQGLRPGWLLHQALAARAEECAKQQNTRALVRWLAQQCLVFEGFGRWDAGRKPIRHSQSDLAASTEAATYDAYIVLSQEAETLWQINPYIHAGGWLRCVLAGPCKGCLGLWLRCATIANLCCCMVGLHCPVMCRLMSKEEQGQYGVHIGADYPQPISASKFGRPHSDGGYRVGGNPGFSAVPGSYRARTGDRASSRGSSASRGGGRSSRGRGSRAKGDFERYG